MFSCGYWEDVGDLGEDAAGILGFYIFALGYVVPAKENIVDFSVFFGEVLLAKFRHYLDKSGGNYYPDLWLDLIRYLRLCFTGVVLFSSLLVFGKAIFDSIKNQEEKKNEAIKAGQDPSTVILYETTPEQASAAVAFIDLIFCVASIVMRKGIED
ncbi:hypothetical protein BELL_0424g00080 [Botrytis elliptica]|uniref:Uncharacterized protein n=1 Tax=Botrytis elliptica TaxID=278938 RepID=A0A4Z1JG92_9HELO|nr:hypothetical protein EAE99_012106 [Botrytis elliptica]TGO72729.1 hypothetical protein BELL_0424g00080 [Botrytis elliptica]